jgi:hypothetical protein
VACRAESMFVDSSLCSPGSSERLEPPGQ